MPKAILVDVYGTLLATGLGEVAAAEEDTSPPLAPTQATKQEPTPESISEISPEQEKPASMFPEGFAEQLQVLIVQDHAKARAAGIPWPEVDAISVFMRVLGLDPLGAAKACVAWECLANPCAAMPGAMDFLDDCRKASLPLGIVSNAQFYTPLFIRAAFGAAPVDLGFEEDLSFWSYRTGRAKPDRFMYDQAAEALAVRGIVPGEVLYVGNDALNDCAAAGEAGFMTVLFAGDERSFRAREASRRVEEFPPDTVVSSWDMLATLVNSSRTNGNQRSTLCI
jgi:putative hydrolase of the HAD superfamily